MNSKETQYIYSLEYPVGNIRYIGKTFDPKRRFQNHLTEALRSKRRYHKLNWLKGVMNDGGKPILNIIDTVTLKDVNFWEEHYIWLYKSWGFNLVNGTNGGDGMSNPTMNTRRKIQSTLKQTYVDGYEAWNKGKVYPEDEREAFRKAASHRRKPILQYDMNGSFMQKHESLSEASRGNDNFDKGALGRVCGCKSNVHSYKGFLWAYEHLINNGTVTPQGLVEKHYIAHNTSKQDKFPTLIDVKTQKIIGQWRSLLTMSKETGVEKTVIHNRICAKTVFDGKVVAYKADIENLGVNGLIESCVYSNKETITLQIEPSTGVILNRFPSIVEASVETGITRSVITAASNMKTYASAPYIWIKEHLLESGKTSIPELMHNYIEKILRNKRTPSKYVA